MTKAIQGAKGQRLSEQANKSRNGIGQIRRTPQTGEKNGGYLADQIYREIARRILYCEIAPGSLINAIGLAKEMSVSRTPVHDALKRLAADRLLVVRPRVGYQVSQVSTEDVQHIFQLRLGLECMAVDLAIRNASSEELEDLVYWQSAPAREKRGLRKANGVARDKFLDQNRLFHEKVGLFSGNPRLANSVHDLLTASNRAIVLYQKERPAAAQLEGPNPHLEIADGMLARDRKRAIDAMDAHIRESLKEIMSVIFPDPISYNQEKEPLLATR